jgi:hypothetical protein
LQYATILCRDLITELHSLQPLMACYLQVYFRFTPGEVGLYIQNLDITVVSQPGMEDPVLIKLALSGQVI